METNAEIRGKRMAKRILNMTILEIEEMMRELYRHGSQVVFRLGLPPDDDRVDSADFEVKLKPVMAEQPPEPPQD